MSGTCIKMRAAWDDDERSTASATPSWQTDTTRTVVSVSEVLKDMWREDADAAIDASRCIRTVDPEFDSDGGDDDDYDGGTEYASGSGPVRMRDLLSRVLRRGSMSSRRLRRPPPPPPMPPHPTPVPAPTSPTDPVAPVPRVL